MLTMELFLRDRGIPIWTHDGSTRHKKVRAGWLGFLCPRCLSGKVHLGFNIEKKYFSCWSCGHISQTQLFKLWFPGENPWELLNALGDFRLGGRFVLPDIEATPTGKFLPPTPIYPLSASPAHQEYLASRGLDWRPLAERYALGAIMQASKWKYNNRLFIPIHDAAGVPASWQTRSILQNAPIPYVAASKTAESAPIKSMLYGMNHVTPYGTVIIVEGVVDMWRINAVQNNHALATFGKEISPAQLRLISQYAVRILCLDNEPQAQQQAKEYCRQLSVYPGTTHNVCLDAPDPASAPQHEIDALLRFAFG